MTASELIQKLKDIHPDTKIVVRGYEDGYNDVIHLRKRKIKTNPVPVWYYGEYSISSDDDAITAIELFGENSVSIE